jgi:hypothetical protein
VGEQRGMRILRQVQYKKRKEERGNKVFPYHCFKEKHMKRFTYTIEINSPVQQAYEKMLGLKDKASYEFWTKAFNPTSSWEGSWEKGSKIYFIGFDDKGNKRGMVSEILENTPAEYVSIRHYGFLEGDQEITTGEQVESWAGGCENYHYSEKDGITTVKVELDSVAEYEDFFNSTYPKALGLLKEIVEA